MMTGKLNLNNYLFLSILVITLILRLNIDNYEFSYFITEISLTNLAKTYSKSILEILIILILVYKIFKNKFIFYKKINTNLLIIAFSLILIISYFLMVLLNQESLRLQKKKRQIHNLTCVNNLIN